MIPLYRDTTSFSVPLQQRAKRIYELKGPDAAHILKTGRNWEHDKRLVAGSCADRIVQLVTLDRDTTKTRRVVGDLFVHDTRFILSLFMGGNGAYISSRSPFTGEITTDNILTEGIKNGSIGLPRNHSLRAIAICSILRKLKLAAFITKLLTDEGPVLGVSTIAELPTMASPEYVAEIMCTSNSEFNSSALVMPDSAVKTYVPMISAAEHMKYMELHPEEETMEMLRKTADLFNRAIENWDIEAIKFACGILRSYLDVYPRIKEYLKPELIGPVEQEMNV